MKPEYCGGQVYELSKTLIKNAEKLGLKHRGGLSSRFNIILGGTEYIIDLMTVEDDIKSISIAMLFQIIRQVETNLESQVRRDIGREFRELLGL